MKPCVKFCHVSTACACPTCVIARGGSTCHCHASMPALMSSMMPGLVSFSLRCSCNCKMVLSQSVCASGLGHCKMWPVSLSRWSQRGHALMVCFFICAILWPVVQNPVVNLTFHLRMLIVWLFTTFPMLLQSTKFLLMFLNLVFPAQYAFTTLPAICSRRWYFKFVLIFLVQGKFSTLCCETVWVFHVVVCYIGPSVP